MRKIINFGLAAVALAAAADAGSAAPVEKVVLKQNGIKRPDSGTVTGKLWDIADEISMNLGRPAQRKEVVDRYLAEQPNANSATANTQYARWVIYHGATEALREIRVQETAARREAAKREREEANAGKKAEREAAAYAKEEEKAKREAEKQAAAERKAQEKADRDAARAEKARIAEEEKAAKAKAKAEAKAAKEAEAKKDNAA